MNLQHIKLRLDSSCYKIAVGKYIIPGVYASCYPLLQNVFKSISNTGFYYQDVTKHSMSGFVNNKAMKGDIQHIVGLIFLINYQEAQFELQLTINHIVRRSFTNISVDSIGTRNVCRHWE